MTAGRSQRSQVQILPPLQIAFSQVIPEGAGPVKSVGRLFFLSPTRSVSAPMRRAGSRLGRSPTAERPEGLDGVAVRRIMFGLSGTSWWGFSSRS